MNHQYLSQTIRPKPIIRLACTVSLAKNVNFSWVVQKQRLYLMSGLYIMSNAVITMIIAPIHLNDFLKIFVILSLSGNCLC